MTQAQAAQAVGHPLRREILDRLRSAEQSPSMLAELMGSSLGTVSYHVRVLNRCGALRLTRTEQRRGAVEHYYKAKVQVTLRVREIA